MEHWPRFQYHFEPKSGWMNDPNGLVFFRGRYHIFYQHYPHAPRWGQMHWGHAVSTDLIHWEELPIALYPDMPYEDDGGCFSGSAVVKDDRLYLFYTSVSHELGQTQSVAYSDDGVNFRKYEDNPVISRNPLGAVDFRDPKVTLINGVYHMVVGSGDAETGKVLLFLSEDLLHWDYSGVLFEAAGFGPCIECPDFFPMDSQYVLMFSKINEPCRSTHFAVGDFRHGKLENYTISRPEWGPDFYAPQTFFDGCRRIMIGWMYHWGKTLPTDCGFAGALSIPRELTLRDKRIHNYPVQEATGLLKTASSYVRADGDSLIFIDWLGNETMYRMNRIKSVDILEDTKSVEVFINGGQDSFSFWLV